MFDFEYDPEVKEKTAVEKERVLLSEGPAYFVVENVMQGVSKASGNNQLIVTMMIKDESGKSCRHIEYFPSVINMAWKLKGLLSGIGKSSLYAASGRFDESRLIGGNGSCMIKHASSEQYGVQHAVKFYYDKPEVKSSSTPHHVQQAVANGVSTIEDDDLDGIPF